MNDKLLLLSGAGGAVQDIGAITSAGALTTDWIDMKANADWGDGRQLFGKVQVSTEAVDSATKNALLECQLVTYPVLASAAATTLANCDAAATGGIVTIDASVTAHGLSRGQRLSCAVPGSSTLTTAIDYYVRDVLSTTTFTLALTPDKDAAIVTLVNTTNDLDLVIESLVVGSTGGLPIAAYHDQALVAFAMNPSFRNDNPAPGRYLYGHFLPTHTLTAGKVLMQLGTDPGHRRVYHATGTPMPIWAP